MSATESSIAQNSQGLCEALVVESRFASRRALIADLRESSFASEITEAKSVLDGFRILQTRNIDACILGPALSRDVAVEFVNQARFETKNRACAFIAVLEPSAKSLAGLRAAGVDGTITTPYTTRSFSQICSAATEAAKRRACRPRSVIWANAIELPNEELVARLTAREEEPKTLDVALFRASDALLEISERISRGELKLQRTGHPSLAAADAIRLAFESAFPYDSTVRESGSDDNAFVSSLVQWLLSLIDQPFVCATEELRRSLVLNTKRFN